MQATAIRLILPKEILSLNKTSKGLDWRARFFTGRENWREWRLLIQSEARKLCGSLPKLNGSKKRVTITRVFGHRQRPFDQDNLAGGCKGLIDAMKGILIKDDNPNHAEFHFKQVKGQRGHTVIEVEDADTGHEEAA